ncbi:DNA-dependent metalloprotease dvc-1 [Vanessa cardui]|uniref:DNA-dependent metalloprotease dvc-1 n=1 Tax=Vanessa cardui TaxID=171605 RepID=UPI001F137F09|nr:DNA-dependent metalloprotease dvc-1 [Vanessa cardui]
MNLADPDLELVDPTPNVHALFIHFDKIFFWTQLASRAVVRWSKRMYSCAGTCSYDRCICDIALSEPLLKLRPRKDLVETLLHEMIHAYLFITDRDRDRDGHGPNFQKHMHRINKAAGLNISIYHDFHDEVKLYQTHWWRCDGPCQYKKPHFGIVRRSMNRAPGPSDYWWNSHKRNCGGTFVKFKEPEKHQKKKAPTNPKPVADITKYTKKTNKDGNTGKVPNSKPVLKDSNMLPNKSNTFTKSNSSSTVVVTKKNNIVFNPQVTKPIVVFSGKGQTIGDSSTTNSDDVVERVRNVWANKDLPMTFSSNTKSSKKVPKSSTNTKNLNKHKADETAVSSPPAKIKKIDDYFKSNATSVLKDLYGQDFVITEVNSNKRLSVVAVKSDLVDCPVCSSKISSTEINRHLDECLNKEIIETICSDNEDTKPVIIVKADPDKVNNNIPVKEKEDIKVPNIKTKSPNSTDVPLRFSNIKTECVDLTDLPNNYASNETSDTNITNTTEYESVLTNDGQLKNKQSGAFITGELEKVDFKTSPKIKVEPGCSENIDKSTEQKCPCCGEPVTKSIEEHFDECLAFFDNNTTIPTEGASTSFTNETIIIDDDNDICDESLTLNATGTKSPCPCCLKMIELADMNDHLDICLS